MRQTKSFAPEMVRAGQRIVIYGAGRYGELALRGLEYFGLRPDCFADRALAGGEYYGVPVIAPDELKRRGDDIVLIASYNHFGEMLSLLRSYGCSHYYDILSLLEAGYDEIILSEYALEEKRSPHKYANAVQAGGEGIVITHCEAVLTERCTLKCRDCANLMQYYRRPQHLDADELIAAFHRFLDSIDALVEMRLLGGEPFLYRDIDRIIEEFADCEKIGGMTVYTNSTIMPEDRILESLKHRKISIHMSDYGPVSGKVSQLREAFDKNEIQYYIHPYDKWCDLGGIEKRAYSPDVKRAVYRSCLSARCYTFYRGKLYICPRAAHGEQLGLYANRADEVVDFTDVECGPEGKREEISAWLKEREYITACDYCNGLSNQSAAIAAAVQVQR